MKRLGSAALLCAGLLLAGTRASAGEESIHLQEAAGRDTTATRCAICHSLDYIEMNAPVMDRTSWDKTVHKMIDRFGAPVTDAEAREIVNYLATHYSHAP